MRKFDLIAMGRACVDLYSEQIGARLEDASSLAKYVGGCPANIAIGSRRLGLRTAILSRVGDEAMGRFVRETFIKEGVDVSYLFTDRERLTGLVLLGVDPPDRFPLIFYRENCADMALCGDDFSAETFASTRALLITGTHCSNEKIFEVTLKAANLAKEAGARVILDIDYRPVLWKAVGHGEGESRYAENALVAKRLECLYPLCDLIVGTEEEVLIGANRRVLLEALGRIRSLSSAVIVLKKGAEGAIAYPQKISSPIVGRSFNVRVLNVLGAGDAFMSGLLKGYLGGLSWEKSLELANANGALVVSRHGCAPAMPYLDELNLFIGNPGDMKKINHIHASLSRFPKPKKLFLLAFDHGRFFEGRDPGRTREFRELVLAAAKNSAETDCGIIVDEQFGREKLQEAEKSGLMVSWSVEDKKGDLLRFLGGACPGSILRSWPAGIIVKVLCRVKEEVSFQTNQLTKLRELDRACSAGGHCTVVELIEDKDDLAKMYRFMFLCYSNAIFPTWWKLPVVDDPHGWSEIERLIENSDPYCRGIVLLGGTHDLKELAANIKKLGKSVRGVVGFAVGRAVWGDIADKWFARKLDNDTAVDMIAKNFNFLLKESAL